MNEQRRRIPVCIAKSSSFGGMRQFRAYRYRELGAGDRAAAVGSPAQMAASRLSPPVLERHRSVGQSGSAPRPPALRWLHASHRADPDRALTGTAPSRSWPGRPKEIGGLSQAPLRILAESAPTCGARLTVPDFFKPLLRSRAVFIGVHLCASVVKSFA